MDSFEWVRLMIVEHLVGALAWQRLWTFERDKLVASFVNGELTVLALETLFAKAPDEVRTEIV